MSATTPTPTCELCGHSDPIYSHNLTSGLVDALVKLRGAVQQYNLNSIHTRRDLDGTPYELTKSQYANWTMLRYHGLIAKDTAAGAGHWLITRRGGAFLRGEQSIPKTVMVQNNKVVGHGHAPVHIRDVMGTTPRFTPLADLDYAMPEGTRTQLSLV